MNPLCSILINNYNNGPYIEDCILSALNQTYPNLEVIVYDDGSTDNSIDILHSFAKDIKLIASKENYGKSSNFNQMNAINQAFTHARGKYIFLLDGDDLFIPKKVELITRIFAQSPQIVMVQNMMQEIDGDGIPKPAFRPHKETIYPRKLGMSYKEFVLKYENLLLFASTSGLAFTKAYLDKVMPMKEDRFTMIWPDVRLTRQAIFHGRIFFCKEILGYYRNHDKNWSNTQRIEKAVIEQMYEYFNSLKPMQSRTPIKFRNYKLKKWTTPFYLKRKVRLLTERFKRN
ncbi:MAG: hypothetical protein Kow0027_28300 [Saprospiraceae bacterium]